VLGLAPLSRTRFPFLGRIAADDRAVWFVSALSVGRIDPRTNRLTASVHANRFERRLAARPDYADLGAAVVVDGDLWVADPGTPAIVRVGRAS
jgi:streptogramin lyase